MPHTLAERRKNSPLNVSIDQDAEQKGSRFLLSGGANLGLSKPLTAISALNKKQEQVAEKKRKEKRKGPVDQITQIHRSLLMHSGNYQTPKRWHISVTRAGLVHWATLQFHGPVHANANLRTQKTNPFHLLVSSLHFQFHQEEDRSQRQESHLSDLTHTSQIN